jgi:hypothetical protein
MYIHPHARPRFGMDRGRFLECGSKGSQSGVHSDVSAGGRDDPVPRFSISTDRLASACGATTNRCGSCANESAFKAAFMAYRHRQREETHQIEFTAKEMSSCMNNQTPGSPDLTILSFTSAFHGRLFGSLSATRSKAIHKVDIPAFDCEYEASDGGGGGENRSFDEQHILISYFCPAPTNRACGDMARGQIPTRRVRAGKCRS